MIAGFWSGLFRRGGTVSLLAVLGLALLLAPGASAAEEPIRVGPGVYLTEAGAVDAKFRSSQRVRSRASPEPRIVGGSPIDISQAPWQVAITANPAVRSGSGFDRQFCGGSLVSPTLVVSAAHCFFDPATGAAVPPEDVAAITGRTVLSSDEGQESPLATYFLYTDGNGNLLYDPRTSAWDVALLQLSHPSASTPIKLAGPDERELWANGRAVQVSGWGTTSFQGPDSDHLRAAELAILPDLHCQRSLPMDPTTSLCSGVVSGVRDACQGDSGGPLVAPTLDGGARLVGNVQSGFECGRSQNPGIYGRLGADPVQRALRESAMQVAGDDIVGTGAQPPITLTQNQAIELALVFSEDQCERDRKCRQFSARSCKPRGVGFQCVILNFGKSRRVGKFTCERKMLWTANTGTIVRQTRSQWKCFRGW